MSSAPTSSRSRRRPRPRAIPRSTTPAAPLAPEDYEWLWCDDNSKITQWFLTKSLSTYEEFYVSFINFANTAWETSHRADRAPLDALAEFVVGLLEKEQIPANEMLVALEEYAVDPWKKRRQNEKKGLVKVHPGLNVHDLTYGKSKLQQKVTAYLRKTEKQLRVAHPQASERATMADQQPLPAFTAPSLASTLSVPAKSDGLLFVGGRKVVKEDDVDSVE
ncbi:hypothetical protein KCU81_g7801, partial [Aureobasidium melanogenum]|uniref:Uncharacterized protein n=1 Tax=Aureobasidium melanogenum (strain CBS 110374) TaxID=1043003 RepID=A0A074VH90_AURM1